MVRYLLNKLYNFDYLLRPTEFEFNEDVVEKDGYNIDKDMLPSSSEEEADFSDQDLDNNK